MFPPNSKKNNFTIHSNTWKPDISKCETNWKTTSQSQQNSVGRITISCSPRLNFGASELSLEGFSDLLSSPQIPIQFDFFGGNVVALKLV
jgi:hypothetical protein